MSTYNEDIMILRECGMTADILSVRKSFDKPTTLLTKDAMYSVRWDSPFQFIVKYAPDGSKMKFTSEQIAWFDKRGWATDTNECIAWFAIRE